MWDVAVMHIHCNVTNDMIGFSCVHVLSVLPHLVMEPYMYTCTHSPSENYACVMYMKCSNHETLKAIQRNKNATHPRQSFSSWLLWWDLHVNP